MGTQLVGYKALLHAEATVKSAQITTRNCEVAPILFVVAFKVTDNQHKKFEKLKLKLKQQRPPPTLHIKMEARSGFKQKERKPKRVIGPFVMGPKLGRYFVVMLLRCVYV